MARRWGWLPLAAAALLALGACHRKPKPPPEPPPPLSFVHITPDAKVSLTLDRGFLGQSGLRQQVYDAGVQNLTTFSQHAHDDRAHLLAKNIASPPYERTVTWTLTVATPRLAAARESWFDDTGGAHPNHGSKGLIWSILTDTEVPASALIRPDADQNALDDILCSAIKTARARREGATANSAAWPCPRWADSGVVPTASTVPGKIGGLTFLFDPYVLGPYAEGDYAVTVPQAQLRRWLSPTYAMEFAGAPLAPPSG